MGSPASLCGLGAWWPFRRMGYPPLRAGGRVHAARPCALYGKPLKRTPTAVCVLALERRRGGAPAAIHPIDFRFHPMDRPIHPMEFSIQGHFRVDFGGSICAI